MNMDIHLASYRLYKQINAPRGVVGVLAWPLGRKPRIRVFVSKGYSHRDFLIPHVFDGYRVDIETMEDASPFLTEQQSNVYCAQSWAICAVAVTELRGLQGFTTYLANPAEQFLG